MDSRPLWTNGRFRSNGPENCSAVRLVPRSTNRLLARCGRTNRRISYLVGIYKSLHILLPDDLADGWVTQPNDNLLFRGQAPVDYMVRSGIPTWHTGTLHHALGAAAPV